jgi:hypothetical protein
MFRSHSRIWTLLKLRFLVSLAILSRRTMGADELRRMMFDVKFERALDLSDDNEGKPLRLISAGDLASDLFCESSENADLDKAIVAYEEAIKLVQDGHQCQAELYSQLGVSLLRRIANFGNVADIENAIIALECSLILTPDGHADKPARLSNLGISFVRRFEHSGDLADVSKAISAHQQAVGATPNNHGDKPGYLGNLGGSFLRQFQSSGNLSDVNEAISTLVQAVHCPSHS